MAIIDSYPVSNWDSFTTGLYSGYRTYAGQSFTGDGNPLNDCVFYLAKQGSPTGYITAYLYAETHTTAFGIDSIPTGSPLATSTSINIASLLIYPTLNFLRFTFDSPYTTVNGTKYCIVLYYGGGDAGNSLQIGLDISSPSHDGNFFYYSDAWYADDVYDLIFYCNTGTGLRLDAIGTPATGNSALTPAIPPEAAVGDKLLVLAYSRVDSITFTVSAGWDENYDPGGQTNGSWFVASRTYQSGDGDPMVTPSSNESIIAFIVALYNFDPTTLFDVAIAGSAFAVPGSPYDVTLAGFNTNTDGALAFFCWGSLDNNTWVYQSGGATQQVSQDNTTGSDNSMQVDTKSMPTAGATGDQVSRQTNKAGDAGRILWFAIKPVVSGTTFYQSVGGVLPAAAGGAGKMIGKGVSGVLPSASGGPVKGTSVYPDGVLPASYGLLTKMLQRSLGGALSGVSGVLDAVLIVLKALDGLLPAPEGRVEKKVSKFPQGVLSELVGVLTKETSKFPTGELPEPLGLLLKEIRKSLSGTVPIQTGVLEAVKLALKLLEGTLPAQTGLLEAVKLAIKTLEGITPAPDGSVVRKTTKSFDGTLPEQSGGLARKTVKFPSGLLPMQTGIVNKGTKRFLTGNLPMAVGALNAFKITEDTEHSFDFGFHYK